MTETRKPSPLDRLGALAVQDVEIGENVRHVEIYTLEGLLSLVWHGPRDAERVVLAFGGAMGSLLGPADGLYHDLGVRFAREGIGTIRIGYRRPNDLERCVLDVGAAADLASRSGGRRFVVVGHSFGGAVAVNAARAMKRNVVGVVTLATQSAGCQGEPLGDRPLLLLHGDSDELLPLEASQMVSMLSTRSEVVILPATGHLLRESAEALRAGLGTWIPACFEPAGPGSFDGTNASA